MAQVAPNLTKHRRPWHLRAGILLSALLTQGLESSLIKLITNELLDIRGKKSAENALSQKTFLACFFAMAASSDPTSQQFAQLWQGAGSLASIIATYVCVDDCQPQPTDDCDLASWQATLGDDDFRQWVLAHRHQVNGDDQPWHTLSIAELTDHLITAHHRFCQRELSRMALLLESLPTPLTHRWEAFSVELRAHMLHEEETLFPALKRLEDGDSVNAEEIDAVLRTLEHEHEHIESGWAELLADLEDHEPQLGPILSDFQRDLDLHGTLEENYLFPAAADLAERGRRRLDS